MFRISEKTKLRQSNFELLRIICMVSIVIGHFLSQTNSYEILIGSNLIIASFLGKFLRIATSIFLILGCWFLVPNMNSNRKSWGGYGCIVNIGSIHFPYWLYCF